MDTENEIVNQLNYFRSEYSKGKDKFISRIVYMVYRKYYEKPLKKEGFNFLMKYKACPKFKGEKKKIYEYYY